ncbi:MAG: hypothetical protein ACJAS9_001308 [Polaribacter sp.]|jgi:hypothetical protein
MKLPLYRSKNLTSIFPLLMISAVIGNANAYGELENKISFGNTVDLPSEAFLDFLASGITVKSDAKADVKTGKKSSRTQIISQTQFIDPMEIQELDDIGLLTKLKISLSNLKSTQSNNVLKEDKE